MLTTKLFFTSQPQKYATANLVLQTFPILIIPLALSMGENRAIGWSYINEPAAGNKLLSATNLVSTRGNTASCGWIGMVIMDPIRVSDSNPGFLVRNLGRLVSGSCSLTAIGVRVQREVHDTTAKLTRQIVRIYDALNRIQAVTEGEL